MMSKVWSDEQRMVLALWSVSNMCTRKNWHGSPREASSAVTIATAQDLANACMQAGWKSCECTTGAPESAGHLILPIRREMRPATHNFRAQQLMKRIPCDCLYMSYTILQWFKKRHGRRFKVFEIAVDLVAPTTKGPLQIAPKSLPARRTPTCVTGGRRTS